MLRVLHSYKSENYKQLKSTGVNLSHWIRRPTLNGEIFDLVILIQIRNVRCYPLVRSSYFELALMSTFYTFANSKSYVNSFLVV
jgi:hypothetical protein